MTTAIEQAAPTDGSPWRNRDFRLVWGGGLVNDLGDWLLIVALPLYVFTETSSGVATALLFLVAMAPAIFLGRLAGRLVDRWDLRRTLIATNVLQAVALVPLLAVTPDRIWPAFVVAAAQSVLTRFNNPAKAALLPRVVPGHQLLAANAANAVSDNVARLVGSPLGGIVVETAGMRGVVIADGVSFVVVALATWRVRRDAGTPISGPVHTEAGADHDSAAPVGQLRIRGQSPLPALIATVGLSQFAQGLFLVLFIAFVVRRLGGDGAAVGLIRGMQAIGGVLGGIVIGRLARRAPPGRLMGWGYIGMGTIGLITWNAPRLTTAVPLYVALFIAAGVPAVACSVGLMAAAQQFTPPQHLGQLVGTVEAVSAAGVALGTLAAGVLVDRVPVDWLLDGQAAVYLLCGTIAVTFVNRSPADPRAEPAGVCEASQ